MKEDFQRQRVSKCEEDMRRRMRFPVFIIEACGGIFEHMRRR